MSILQKPVIDEQEISIALSEAVKIFNDTYEADFILSEMKVAYCTMSTFSETYERLCSQYFPSWLKENYKSESFYKDTLASALIEGDNVGILINTSCSFPFAEWVRVLLHELAHLYAVQNEFNGANFYKEFCADTDIHMIDDLMYIGYSVWKEFIADFMSVYACPYYPIGTIYQYRKRIKESELQINGFNAYSFRAASVLLAYLFGSKEFAVAKSWDEYWTKVESRKLFDCEMYKNLVHLVYNHLKTKAHLPHEISEDFIAEIGCEIHGIINRKALMRMFE